MTIPTSELQRMALQIAVNGNILTELIEEVAGLGPDAVEAVLRHITDPLRGDELSECGQDFIGQFALALHGITTSVTRPGEVEPRGDPVDRQCRICGCTDIGACTEADGSPCCWADDDLCSACMVFQDAAGRWARATFPKTVVENRLERGARVLEESAEICQHLNIPAEKQHAIIDYVNARPREEDARREVGGIMMTLAVACEALGIDMMEAAPAYLARYHRNADAIRAKQENKPAAVSYHDGADE